LTTETKDFQIAAWLCDAWIRTSQIEGLHIGLELVHRVAEQYWDCAWPEITDNDCDRRVAPFVWMNSNLPLTLRLHGVLLPASLYRSQAITLLDWENAPIADDAKSGMDAKLSRRDIRDSVMLSDSDWLHTLSKNTSHCLHALQQLTQYLDHQLAKESPSLAKLENQLLILQSAVDDLSQRLPEPKTEAAHGMEGADSAGEIPNTSANLEAVSKEFKTNSGKLASGQSIAEEPWQLQLDDAGLPIFHTKAHAYAALEAIAAYLHTTDPHDPAPYLVQRAVELGNMPFPQLIQEITATAGSMEKFFELLGIDAGD
jgi:type VI secretion system protein ImpA